ncbi:hypothetical protein KIPE111705_23010 [Kibdelosporangium persicum]|uniref:hypothetical protein n=1 Tax=Kibdelosporangium persicum TaxID=2698649 RepID=UPI00156531FF|nr:hypothetical protein [Kibdelosporangium persicum]
MSWLDQISSELMVAAAKLLRDKASAMLDAMMQDFERATGPRSYPRRARPARTPASAVAGPHPPIG